MSLRVFWTKESEFTFNDNIDYLTKEWNSTAINNFLDRVDEVVENISKHPKLYPLHRKKTNIYKCVVNDHITLYYRIINKDRIDLITFWNTHQNPENLKS